MKKKLKVFHFYLAESRSRYDDSDTQWQSDYRTGSTSPSDDRRSSLGNNNRSSVSSLKKTSESNSYSNGSTESQKEVNLFDFDDPPVTSTISNKTTSNDFGAKLSYILSCLVILY